MNMNERTCKKCGSTDFYASSSSCRPCTIARACRAAKADPKRVAANTKRWADKNRDKIKAKNDAYHKDPEVLKRKLETAKRWQKNNPDKVKLRHSNRMKTDLDYRIRTRIRGRLRTAIQSGKAGSAIADLGCSIDELKSHLERQFSPGMTWDNWSFTGWHIDHIKPLASFDLTIREQFVQACHYSNLQPLWATDNLKKQARV